MKRPIHIAAWGLVALLVVGGVFSLGAQGDQNDPLITLSYLNQVVTPATDAKVTQTVAAAQTALADKLGASIDAFVRQVEDKLSASDGGASFTTVTVAAGQTLSGKTGVEIVLRSGGAVAAGDLLDITDGSTAARGHALSEHHLYIAQTAGPMVIAERESSVMARGDFTIE